MKGPSKMWNYLILLHLSVTCLRLDDVVEVAGERPGQPQDVGVLPLRVAKRVDLRFQLDVDGARRLAQLLEDGLARALVRRDGPVLPQLQLDGRRLGVAVRAHGGAGARQRDRRGCGLKARCMLLL